jgi:hypothetical protein
MELRSFASVLREVDGRSGALVRRPAAGSAGGAIFAERGRVCWARSDNQRGRLAELLVGESSDPHAREALDSAVRFCQTHRVPLSARLASSGLVAESRYREALLRHTCEAIRDLALAKERWDWIEHSGAGYCPALTFSPAEIFAGVHALAEPSQAVDVHQRLAKYVYSGQRALAVTFESTGRTPLAHLRCDDLDVHLLFELIEQIHELMVLSTAARGQGLVAALGRFSCAAWVEQGILYIVLDDDDLAFNRLVSPLVTATVQR